MKRRDDEFYIDILELNFFSSCISYICIFGLFVLGFGNMVLFEIGYLDWRSISSFSFENLSFVYFFTIDTVLGWKLTYSVSWYILPGFIHFTSIIWDVFLFYVQAFLGYRGSFSCTLTIVGKSRCFLFYIFVSDIIVGGVLWKYLRAL